MATTSERIPVTIVCDNKRHDVQIQSSKPHGLPIVDDLQQAAEEATGIPVSKQRVIFKGKTLRNPGSMLCEVDIEPFSRVMIVGQRFDPEQDAACSSIQKTLDACQEAEKKMKSVQEEMNGITMGYLPESLHAQSLTKLARTAGGITEQLVKQLEKLDALILGEEQTQARTRRKAAVKHIQATLDRVDAMIQSLTDLQKKNVEG